MLSLWLNESAKDLKYCIIFNHLQWYQHQHDKPMSTPAVAQMLSTMLYGKRFFPYYVWNTLGGLDENGIPLTLTEKKKGMDVFSVMTLLEIMKKECITVPDLPGILSNLSWTIKYFNITKLQIGRKHLPDSPEYTIDDVKLIVKDAFTSATERDIYTGDFLEIFVITSNGVTKEIFPLKRD